MSKTIDALWIGPYIGEIGRQVLVPGETVARVSADEARDSDHWQPVTKKAAATSEKGEA